jgi:hypothetical protein
MGERDQLGVGGAPAGARVECQQHLSHRAGVQRHDRTGDQHLRAAVAAEDVMGYLGAAGVEGGDPRRLPGARGQRIRPVDRLGPQLVLIESGPAQPEHLDVHPVGAAALILLSTKPTSARVRTMPCAVPLASPRAVAICDRVSGSFSSASSRKIAAARSTDCTVPGTEQPYAGHVVRQCRTRDVVHLSTTSIRSRPEGHWAMMREFCEEAVRCAPARLHPARSADARRTMPSAIPPPPPSPVSEDD